MLPYDDILRCICQVAEAATNQQGNFYSGAKNIFYTTARIAQLMTLHVNVPLGYVQTRSVKCQAANGKSISEVIWAMM